MRRGKKEEGEAIEFISQELARVQGIELPVSESEKGNEKEKEEGGMEEKEKEKEKETREQEEKNRNEKGKEKEEEEKESGKEKSRNAPEEEENEKKKKRRKNGGKKEGDRNSPSASCASDSDGESNVVLSDSDVEIIGARKGAPKRAAAKKTMMKKAATKKPAKSNAKSKPGRKPTAKAGSLSSRRRATAPSKKEMNKGKFSPSKNNKNKNKTIYPDGGSGEYLDGMSKGTQGETFGILPSGTLVEGWDSGTVQDALEPIRIYTRPSQGPSMNHPSDIHMDRNNNKNKIKINKRTEI